MRVESTDEIGRSESSQSAKLVAFLIQFSLSGGASSDFGTQRMRCRTSAAEAQRTRGAAASMLFRNLWEDLLPGPATEQGDAHAASDTRPENGYEQSRS